MNSQLINHHYFKKNTVFTISITLLLKIIVIFFHATNNSFLISIFLFQRSVLLILAITVLTGSISANHGMIRSSWFLTGLKREQFAFALWQPTEEYILPHLSYIYKYESWSNKCSAEKATNYIRFNENFPMIF